MELTGIIIFFRSLLSMIIWILRVLVQLGSKENFLRRHLYNEGPTINILPGLILFISMAISAGMAWG